ncbi:MAG TPA: patatin-like phospholipase family protein [Allosphingosinicella sp.]|jgi:NTE family protein|nr:patatin-like phospholipase family protein [Allosphingosinicella sp.]
MDAYGIFQGGGAKGYAHVGALKAAEQRGIRFVRLGGSSAGAIVAALAAAGYTADELLDPSKPMGSRGVLDVDVSEILDAREYARVTRAMRRYAAFNARPQPATGVVGWWRRAKRSFPQLVIMRFVGRLVVPELAFGIGVYRRLGAVATEPVVRWLDDLLRAKVGTSGAVTFGDLGMKLRMVAADVTNGEMHTFGFPGDDTLPVAPAAIASACFPFFFRPARNGDRMFIDGGLMSNLPVWLFDDERDDETSHLPTFGFRLVNDALVARPAKPPTHFLRFTQRLAQTLLSGGRNLEERRVDYYSGIDLRARIGTLSFDTVREAAPTLVADARKSVEKYFEREVGPQDPARMAKVLTALVNLLAEHYDWSGERIRAHVLLPDINGRHARTVYTYNMDADADDHLRVRTDVDGVGAVFRLREPVYVLIGAPRPKGQDALKYELSARPPQVKGLYSVPMFDDIDEWSKDDPLSRTPPFAALVLDRTTDFAPLAVDQRQQDTFANVAAIIGEAIRDRSIVRPQSAEASRPRSGGWDDLLSTAGLRVAARKMRDAGDGELGVRLSLALRRLDDAATPTGAHGPHTRAEGDPKGASIDQRKGPAPD